MTTIPGAHGAPPVAKPWPALWSLIVGFFMILIDTTIVSVANPKIMEGLGTDINAVIWVTSAYLLAYAVPLLITGRLGDRFGPKNLYLAGLVVFTLSSLWCGFAGTIEMLIVARIAQGLGAALMTPQTMAVITRIFPPDKRGAAMGIWGSVAGVATLVGPILGGVLVDSLGWAWIFFINLPIGVVGFFLALRFVPKLETHQHSFDILGVVLSGAGMFLLVFGIQELNSDSIATGVKWAMIVAGIVVLALFVIWQALNRKEPLLPLKLFRDRNFSLANGAITAVGFTVTCLSLPLVFFFQIVYGYSPTQSALMLVPMAVVSTAIAPFVGRRLDTMNPRNFAIIGTVLLSASLFLYSRMLTPDDTQWAWLLIPSAIMGVANGFMWAPISNTATRNLAPQQAGAGSGVFNTTRQIGAVIGSASIAALIESRLAANLPAMPGGGKVSEASFGGGALPEALKQGFTDAMSQAILLPAFGALLAAIIVVWFAKPKRREGWGSGAGNTTGSLSLTDAVIETAGQPVVGGAGAAAAGAAPVEAVEAVTGSHDLTTKE
ncbi:DHA2 family efflux MFS transporter permease subunit [Schumannella luteola]|uniref:EmrB/QacA subfamily drug resistance transporter n=1 Tax=Schumannella luteola TaxID=472059 RepID=A0A852YM16_9MICO|nr:DHA2 family efflux MFS transporter permease subunit [Schumannella luteola]NYG98265.1 EmrB/QacA subfamily drug resistance transporter [Schumannella luteola]TPX05708.1 DHA2 family efflux MFS transporter permease subunit [Schumannella luteola]